MFKKRVFFIKESKPLLMFCFICLIFLVKISAQQESDLSAARLIDEFYRDELATRTIVRFDQFAIALQDNPTVKGYIVTYRYPLELPGRSARTLNWAKLYMTGKRGISPERIVLIDGGVVRCPVTELWIVPPGTTPKIQESLYRQTFVDTDSARKFDEYYFELDNNPDNPYIDIETNYGRSLVDSLQAFVAALKNEPKTEAYIIAYPQYYGYDNSTDSLSIAAKMLRQVKNRLVKEYRVSPNRIKVMNGGYRKLRQIELWIVPRGGHPPIATPNAFPRKRRK